MTNLMLNATEATELECMIKLAEEQLEDVTYFFDPGFTSYSCSCTAHKKSCGWD